MESPKSLVAAKLEATQLSQDLAKVPGMQERFIYLAGWIDAIENAPKVEVEDTPDKSVE